MVAATSPFIAIDVETTGLGPNTNPPREDGIVQVGIAWHVGDEILSTQWLTYPGPMMLENGRAAGAFRVNRLNEGEVRASPSAYHIAPKLHDLLHELRPDGGAILCSYNSPFDRWFLERSPWDLGTWAWDACLMERAKVKYRVGYWLKLTDACARAGIPVDLGRAHGAAYDAELALRLRSVLYPPPSASSGVDVRPCAPDDASAEGVLELAEPTGRSG